MYHAIVCSDHSIGLGDGGVYYRCDVLDIASNTWKRAPDLPLGLHGLFPVNIDGSIHIAGAGLTRAGSNSNYYIVLENAAASNIE